MSTLGDRKRARYRAGQMKQHELAAAAGCSIQLVRKYEKMTAEVPSRTLQFIPAMERALGVDLTTDRPIAADPNDPPVSQADLATLWRAMGQLLGTLPQPTPDAPTGPADPTDVAPFGFLADDIERSKPAEPLGRDDDDVPSSEADER